MLRFVHGGRDSECSGVKGGRETRDEDGADAPWEAANNNSQQCKALIATHEHL